MEMYVKPTHYQLWQIITKGYILVEAIEEEKEFNSIQFNNKARYPLICVFLKMNIRNLQVEDRQRDLELLKDLQRDRKLLNEQV